MIEVAVLRLKGFNEPQAVAVIGRLDRTASGFRHGIY
jgi:hypothetical protein